MAEVMKNDKYFKRGERIAYLIIGIITLIWIMV